MKKGLSMPRIVFINPGEERLPQRSTGRPRKYHTEEQVRQARNATLRRWRAKQKKELEELRQLRAAIQQLSEGHTTKP